jgi:hypothetical protein
MGRRGACALAVFPRAHARERAQSVMSKPPKKTTPWRERAKDVLPAALTPQARQRKREWLYEHAQYLGQLLRNEAERR